MQLRFIIVCQAYIVLAHNAMFLTIVFFVVWGLLQDSLYGKSRELISLRHLNNCG